MSSRQPAALRRLLGLALLNVFLVAVWLRVLFTPQVTFALVAVLAVLTVVGSALLAFVAREDPDEARQTAADLTVVQKIGLVLNLLVAILVHV